jgi:hypothetical protein
MRFVALAAQNGSIPTRLRELAGDCSYRACGGEWAVGLLADGFLHVRHPHSRFLTLSLVLPAVHQPQRGFGSIFRKDP